MDSYLLTLGGSTVDLGSYVRADPGVDWGTRDLLKAVYAENPVAEGGRLAYETVGVRKLQFPLLLPSGGAGLSLAGLESLLALLARPGAVLDVKPQGVATGGMVRFDVLTGRWEPDPNVRHWEIGVRLGTLRLDTQPFAYLPTWITLASTASVGLPGRFEIPNASLLGDIPGYGLLVVQPSNPPETTDITSTWDTDTLIWSVGARPSHMGFLTGASWTSAIPSGRHEGANAEIGVPAAGATYLRIYTSPTGVGWTQMAYYDIATTLEPAHRGRYRAYAYIGNDPRLSRTDLQFSLDAVNKQNASAAMASAQAIASLGGQVTATAYQPQLLDLGDITLPAVASGAAQITRLRLWLNRPTYADGSNSFLWFSGIHLLPIDGPNGVQTKLQYPLVNLSRTARFVIDGRERAVYAADIQNEQIATSRPLADALPQYRGGFPMVGASTVAVDLLAAQRLILTGATYTTRVAPLFAQAQLSYQPRFLFLKGEV